MSAPDLRIVGGKDVAPSAADHLLSIAANLRDVARQALTTAELLESAAAPTDGTLEPRRARPVCAETDGDCT